MAAELEENVLQFTICAGRHSSDQAADCSIGISSQLDKLLPLHHPIPIPPSHRKIPTQSPPSPSLPCKAKQSIVEALHW